MELKVIYKHEEMRDMVVHVNSEGLQKIMEVLADERNIIVTQLTPRALDVCPVWADGDHIWEETISGSVCKSCGKRQ